MLLKALAAFLVAGSVAQAAPMAPSQDEMITGLNTIEQIFHDQYAMQVWNKHHLGFDLAKRFDLARAQVTPKTTLKEFQRIVKLVLNDMNDYHVSIRFLRTEKATLPLTIRSAQGHYFLAYIDRSQLSQSTFPYQIGDEVLQFNGHPVDQEIQAIRAVYYGGTAVTDQALAELMLTARFAAAGLDVPSGPVLLKIRSHTTGAVSDHQLIWNYTPEEIQSNSAPASIAMDNSAADDGSGAIKFPKREMLWGAWEGAGKFAEDNPIGGIGTRSSYIPDLGTKIWESSAKAKFHAYIFRSPANHLIGYIRIPHYEGDATWAAEFAGLIAKMEPATDALVLDEINNPGGSVFYLYALASYLTQQPLFTPHHQMKITQADVSAALQLLQQLSTVTDDKSAQALAPGLSGYPASLQVAQFMRSYAQFVIDQWNAGKTLTDPYFIYGVDKINPYPNAVTYSKPILLVINQLDFSGGDFFPAIMQDNQRVTVFGTRTAGAGGYILQNKYPNQLGINLFTVTGSIALRIKNEPIENLGVTPDINYSLTTQDFTTGFVPYKNAIVKAVEGLIK